MDPVVVIVVAIAAVVLIAVIITVLISVLSKRTISFRTGKVKFTSEIPELKARKGAEIVLPQLSSQYYDFMGWYYDAACTERACITKMPADNQVAIVDDNVVIFNQSKFEALFKYDFKTQVIAEAKAKEVERDEYRRR